MFTNASRTVARQEKAQRPQLSFEVCPIEFLYFIDKIYPAQGSRCHSKSTNSDWTGFQVLAVSLTPRQRLEIIKAGPVLMVGFETLHSVEINFVQLVILVW